MYKPAIDFRKFMNECNIITENENEQNIYY